MARCVIIGGADIGDYARVRRFLKEDDFNVYCDSGLRHIEGLCAKPDLIIGDFDSYQNPGLPVETIVLPREKDDTDTVFAAKEAASRGYSDFLLLGVTGGRLDHTLGNVSILLMLDSIGKKGTIADDFSQMEIVSAGTVYVDDSYPYFSLLNIGEAAKGVMVKNAKFPLTDATITSEYQYGISNEVLKGSYAEISVQSGRLLLIKVTNP